MTRTSTVKKTDPALVLQLPGSVCGRVFRRVWPAGDSADRRRGVGTQRPARPHARHTWPILTTRATRSDAAASIAICVTGTVTSEPKSMAWLDSVKLGLLSWNRSSVRFLHWLTSMGTGNSRPVMDVVWVAPSRMPSIGGR